MKLSIIVTVASLLIIGFTGLSYSLARIESTTLSDARVVERQFIDVFRSNRGASVMRGATDYINSCCKHRDAALKLLEDNGFKVRFSGGKEEVESLNEHWKTTKQDYDEFISGTRGSGIWRFWDIFARYRVTLFIKDGEVDRVWAAVDRTTL